MPARSIPTRSIPRGAPVASQAAGRRPARKWRWALPIIVVLAGMALHFSGRSAAAASPYIKSARGNYCIDLQDNKPVGGTPINGHSCNYSQAQAWTVRQDSIRHNTLCVSVQSGSKVAGAPIVASRCNGAAGQVWLHDQAGFYNPNSGLCLSLQPSNPASQLLAATCRQPDTPEQSWLAAGTNRFTLGTMCAQTTGGERVACFAEQQWSTWQTGTPDHQALLNNYTDGTPYEEWCADFVSYVYHVAGQSFTNGSADGWDENDANAIQNMGFTMHDPASYTPKPGDVAYFSYNGGHVEIVVSGGKTPTFVYGNSATIDPATGNGQMAANTITSDGPEGQLVYYLSPN